MSLPKIDVPLYDLTLPSNGKKLSFRPFLVKEEKIMLIAAMSKEEDEVKRSIKQIINNCVVGDFNVDSAPVFDVEYVLMNIRVKSIGDVIKNEYICNNEVNGVKCGAEFGVEIRLNDIVVEKQEVNPEIWLTDKIGVKMKWPTFSSLKSKKPKDQTFDYELLTNCIEYIFDKEQTYKLKEQSKQEIEEFFDGLNKEQFDMMVEYLSKIPKFEVHKEEACPKCGFKHQIDIKDMLSFF